MESLPKEIESIIMAYKLSAEKWDQDLDEITHMLQQTIIYTIDRLRHYCNIDLWWESLPVAEKLRLLDYHIPSWNLSLFKDI